jgi:hypothetical protein
LVGAVATWQQTTLLRHRLATERGYRLATNVRWRMGCETVVVDTMWQAGRLQIGRSAIVPSDDRRPPKALGGTDRR